MSEVESQYDTASGLRWTGRPVWAEIDLDALSSNVRELKSVARGAAVMAVVKANAYGHGIVPVARAALDAGASWLGVVCADEGERLRHAGIEAPILVLGHVQTGEVDRIVRDSLTPTVNSIELATALSRRAKESGRELAVHLKVDTGLHRYGSAPREALALAQAIHDMPSLRLQGLFTHFATGEDVDDRCCRQQFETFLEVAAQLPSVKLRHACNTGTLLRSADMALEMVRPGIGMYGCYPSADLREAATLRPVLSLKSVVARLHRLTPGEGVSYGLTWQASKPSTIALVMCGYGDGLPRSLSNRGQLLVRGQRVPIVGRVCMDMCMLDVTDVPRIAEGDEVVIIGRQGDEEITADEVADLAGTISYEIFCHISSRVPRLYLRGGSLVDVETFVDGPNGP